ncbi:hypothetical protein B0H19DRAFT_1089859 [Mycena capillaripes]|nr:hypothetical protein B0H19DRAFT_1089859 [Mycena capillaripes]
MNEEKRASRSTHLCPACPGTPASHPATSAPLSLLFVASILRTGLSPLPMHGPSSLDHTFLFPKGPWRSPTGLCAGPSSTGKCCDLNAAKGSRLRGPKGCHRPRAAGIQGHQSGSRSSQQQLDALFRLLHALHEVGRARLVFLAAPLSPDSPHVPTWWELGSKIPRAVKR